MKRNIDYGLFILLFVALACRPVLAISWNEFLLIGGLIVVLLGPSLHRLLRRVENFFKHKDD